MLAVCVANCRQQFSNLNIDMPAVTLMTEC
jgi:hypothetical protein